MPRDIRVPTKDYVVIMVGIPREDGTTKDMVSKPMLYKQAKKFLQARTATGQKGSIRKVSDAYKDPNDNLVKRGTR